MSDHTEPCILVPVGTFEWTRVLRRADLPATTKHVAAFTAYYADTRTGDRVRPGQPRLAREAGLSERAIRTHLAVLEDVGLLWRVSRGHGGGAVRIAAQYQLAVPSAALELMASADEDELIPLPSLGSNRHLVPVSPTSKPAPDASKPASHDSKPAPRAAYLSKISPEISPSAARRHSDAHAPANESGWGSAQPTEGFGSGWGANYATTATTGWGSQP